MTELTAATKLTTETATLPAHEEAWSRRLREDPHLLADLARAADGPFHVLHPGTFADNLRTFQATLRAAGMDGQVMYGAKANRSPCFLHQCAAAGAGADVASAPELLAAVAAGLTGPDLVITGPAKSTRLLELALRHDALVAIDALDELRRVVDLASRGPHRARVLLRVLPDVDPASRFGLDEAELAEAETVCAAAAQDVVCEGYSFHLGGYEVEPRAALAAVLVQRCRAARERGLPSRSISIGGGFAVDYVPAQHWTEFLTRHDDSWFHAGRRPARFYPYHQSPTGAAMLAAILAAPAGPAGADETLGQALARDRTRLLLEPGRALLDRSGVSVFSVQGCKTRPGTSGDYGIVTVDGLSMSVSEQWKGSEFLPDPVLWPAADGDGPVAACVGGASCLEYDMLSWRKITFPRRPRRGDLLIYPNTAGYQMDKNESSFHGLPLPARFAVETGPDGAPTWQPTT